jgi:hypothetical protein
MRKLFGFLMVSVAFTALQVATAQAQVMSSEQEQMITTTGGAPEKDASAGQDEMRNGQRNGQNQGSMDAGSMTSANNGEKKKQDHNTAGDMAGMKESASFGMQKKEKEPMTTGQSR